MTMKKILTFCFLLLLSHFALAQELLANVQVNSQQMAGSNQQLYKTLEKSLRDFINNTSWTGKKLQNFEKIKSNFAIVINERDGNTFRGSIVVQAVRPVYNSTYESPLLNINDSKFTFEYLENENLIFNERQFSGKNLIDVISFYVYLILGYDADTFQLNGGQQWFTKAQQISQNSQNQKFDGWAIIEGPRSRGSLINGIINPSNATLRKIYYNYHRAGLDLLSAPDQNTPKKAIYDALMLLKTYENNFQMNYAVNLFTDAKSDEIFSIFDSGNAPAVNMSELKQLMLIFAPKKSDKWNKWK